MNYDTLFFYGKELDGTDHLYFPSNKNTNMFSLALVF